jgi:hypothetical protein
VPQLISEKQRRSFAPLALGLAGQAKPPVLFSSNNDQSDIEVHSFFLAGQGNFQHNPTPSICSPHTTA